MHGLKYDDLAGIFTPKINCNEVAAIHVATPIAWALHDF